MAYTKVRYTGSLTRDAVPMASQPNKLSLTLAKESLADAIVHLQDAAGEIEVGSITPTVPTKIHVGPWRLSRDVEATDASDAQRRRDDLTLLADEVRDLYGRVVAIEAEPPRSEIGR